VLATRRSWITRSPGPPSSPFECKITTGL